MSPSLTADMLVLAHLVFILFVILGGLLCLRWPWIAWLHLPAAAWAALIEFAGWVCPLTPLENLFRLRAGRGAYPGGFVEHYVVPLVYPERLDRPTQVALGLGVLLLNAAVYAWVIRRRSKRRARW